MALTLLEKQLASAAEFELLPAKDQAALGALATSDRNALYDAHEPPARLVRTCPVALLVADVHELDPYVAVQAVFDDDACALTVSRSATVLVRVEGFSRSGQVVKRAAVTNRDGKTITSAAAGKFDPFEMAQAVVDALGV